MPRGAGAVAVALLLALTASVLTGSLLAGSAGSRWAQLARHVPWLESPAAAPTPAEPSRSDAVAARAAPSASAADSAALALQSLLDRRAKALLGHDRVGWLADVDPAAPDFTRRQGEVFDRLAAVPLATWHYTYQGAGRALTPERAGELPAGSWVAQVELAWSLTGAGGGVVRRTQSVTLVPSGRGWRLDADTDGPTVPDLWDLGAVSVQRSGRALLLGTAGPDVLARYAPLTDAAAARVDAVWGTDWPRTTVVEVPATQQQLAQLLGREDDGLDQIAAVTTGELVSGAGATQGDHVVVNPSGFALLAPLGQQVVLTHELTHVATRATAVRAVPLWLSEGFADWVAYSATGLRPDTIAADLLAQVRGSGPPADLPTAAAFDSRRGDVGPAYSGAWWAVDLLARQDGQARLVDLYRAVSAGPAPSAAAPTTTAGADAGSADDGGADDAGGGEAALAAALTTVLGTDRGELVSTWRASLVSAAQATR